MLFVLQAASVGVAGMGGSHGSHSIAIIAGAFIVMAVLLAITAKGLRQASMSVAETVDRLEQDAAPALQAIREVAQDGREMSALVRREAKSVVRTSKRLRKQVRRGPTVWKIVWTISTPYMKSSTTRSKTRPWAWRQPLRTAKRDAQVAEPLVTSVAWTTPMTLGRIAAVLLVVVVAGVVLPDALHAWTPATHIYLGQSILENLALLPTPVADLLRAFPFDFLYGNIAADSSIAKNYAPVSRHCHHWHVGQEIHDHAGSDALRAFGLGYTVALVGRRRSPQLFRSHGNSP